MHLRAALLLCFLAPLNGAMADAITQKCTGQTGALVVSLQGSLEYDPESRGQWRSIELNQTLCEGSRIHVGPYSRASVLLPNGFVARIDEDTVLTFNVLNPDKPALMDLLKGFVHFISRTPKHLQINTPIANAGPEGTEFALSVNDQLASLWVYEGGVKFFNAQGSINLKPGQSAQANSGQTPQARIDIKPEDAVNWALYYPPLPPYPEQSTPIDNNIRTAIRDFRQGRTVTAIDELNNLPPEKKTTFYYKVRGAMLLTVGRVDLAENDIQSILKQNPKDAEALALQSVLALTQNRKEEAYTLAKRSITSNPKSASAYSALSYAEQGRFELEKALQAATQATTLAPHDAMVWARKAELELALGLTSDSEETVQQAEKLDAELERTQTVIGFYHLQQMEADDAKVAFEKALKLDSTSPLARLGLGLAKIRNGDLEEGRQDLEIAATLDPNNSLIRSYLGKAYYEENRNPLAEDQFRLAKERDPKDPTPYFYDALKKQTENRPVEALHDLQKAIELNDNRAVYRSKQLLDSDRAARGATLARIYDNLGFQQRGIVEATSSLQLDPTNYSAHRFLSDSYISQPGRETAQLSELLQAKLLQPININPVQPHLSVSQRGLLNASGIANSSFQDFTRVFEGNRPQLLVSGVAGNLGTFGDETTLSGIYNKFSYSLGQFHYETNGFTRPYGPKQDQKNTLQRHNIYDAFIQWAITNRLNTQFEYIHRETNQGDLFQHLFDSSFSGRNNLNENTFRGGVNINLFTNDHLLASFIRKESSTREYIPYDNPSYTGQSTNINFFESQYLQTKNYYNLVTGFSMYNLKDFNTFPDFPGQFTTPENNRNGHNEYIYINFKMPEGFIGTLGITHDTSIGKDQNDDQNESSRSKLFPKIGLLWDINKNNKFRFAFFRGNKTRPIASIQTLEPTQIAGFNQFFDNTSDNSFSFYGGAIDSIIQPNILAGIELSDRNLFGFNGKTILKKDASKIYFNWTPTDSLAISTRYIFSYNDRPNQDSLFTHYVPIEFKYFHQSGLFLNLSETYVSQIQKSKTDDLKSNTSFFLLDAAIGFRLPKRMGILTLEAKNLFNNKFRYENENTFEDSNVFFNNTEIIPQRTFIGHITLNF